MIRITTSGALRNYKSSLMRSSNNLASARDRVLTQRNFTSYAEDPAAATQAFQLRRSFSRTYDQLDTTKGLIKKFESAWTSVGAIKKDLADAMGRIPAIEGGTDSTAAGRQPLGEVLKSGAEAILQTMNSKYGENFIFSGSATGDNPFSWGANGEVLYRGINVDAGTPPPPEGNPPDPATTDPTSPWGVYYIDNPDYAKLAAMNYEKAFVDVGSGLTEDQNGKLIEASAFNSSISGIDILGFGVDKDGDPQNVASMMKKLGDIYSRCDPKSGEFATAQDKSDATRLGDKLNGAVSELTNKWTELDGKSTYLNVNEERLTDSATALNEQILDIEQCNLADAITEFSWAQYCYNSALKVGNSILSQSLIDYMG